MKCGVGICGKLLCLEKILVCQDGTVFDGNHLQITIWNLRVIFIEIRLEFWKIIRYIRPARFKINQKIICIFVNEGNGNSKDCSINC